MMSLSRQLFFLIFGVMLVTSILVTVLITSVFRDAHLEEVRKHGVGIHLMLAEALAAQVIKGKLLEAEQLLSQAQQADPDIAYLYVTDFDGRLFAHTFSHGFPKALLSTLERGQTGRNHRRLRTRAFSIEHYSAPLIEGMDARLHLGIGDFGYRQHLARVYKYIVAGTGGAMIVILGFGTLTVRRLAKPLAALTTLTNRFAKSKPIDPEEIPAQGSCEIRQLGEAFARMVSQRQALEAEIREKEHFVNRLFDSSPVGLALCEMDGSLVKVNHAYAAILGRSVDETLQLTYWDITPDKYFAQEQQQLESLRGRGRYGPYEKEYRHRDGRLVPVRLSGLLVEQKGKQYIWSVVEDLSVLRQASILEKRLCHIFEYSYEEFYLFDGETLRFLQVSRGALENLGYSLEEMRQLTPLDLKTDYTPQSFAELIAPIHQGRLPLLIFETRHRRKDGSFYPVEVRLQYSREQGISFFFAMIVDLTERKRTEKELADHRAHLEELVARRTAQLEAANKELESFSYSVSHDLRTPLRAIDGFSLALMEDYGQELDDTALDFLGRIRRGAQRMSQLIDDLLQLSRINKSGLNWQTVDLTQMAADIWAELKAADTERHVTLEMGENLQVKGDARLLRILLTNLLGNAWKFTLHKDPGRVAFGCHRNKAGVFYIADNGAGFDMRYADKLFGAFQRLHRTSEFPGTGVGLAIVQRIVHRHGGRIWAEGEVGRGATFYFSLGEAGQAIGQQESTGEASHA